MNVQWSITGLGPLVFGDGRPFSNQPGAHTLRGMDLPNPSTLTGSLIKPLLGDPVDGKIPHLGHFHVRGPLLRVNGDVVYPMPLDGVPVTKGKHDYLVPLRPGDDAGGCDLPDAIQRPAVCDLAAIERDGFSRQKSPEVACLTHQQMLSHLIDSGAKTLEVGVKAKLLREKRVSTAIDMETQKAKDGMLFSSTGVHLGKALVKPNEPADLARHEEALTELVCMTSLGKLAEPPELLKFHLGGERRQAILKREAGNGPFDCPQEVLAAVSKTRQIKLILATPAQFTNGWLPDWLEHECPTARLQFRLVSACVGRRQAVSGWGSSAKNWGPKPVTWLAPAGSVYFLELIDPPADYAERIARAWLQPMSDDSKFRRKGFGLALWGTWKGQGEL